MVATAATAVSAPVTSGRRLRHLALRPGTTTAPVSSVPPRASAAVSPPLDRKGPHMAERYTPGGWEATPRWTRPQNEYASSAEAGQRGAGRPEPHIHPAGPGDEAQHAAGVQRVFQEDGPLARVEV